MNSGKDLVLAKYNWGWDDRGRTTLHGANADIAGNKFSKDDLKIIKSINAYKNYEIK